MKVYRLNIIFYIISFFVCSSIVNAQNSSVLNCNNNIDLLSVEIVDENIPLTNQAQFNLFCPLISPGNGYVYDHALEIDTAQLFIHAEDSCGAVLEPIGIKIDYNAYLVFGYLDINISNAIEIDEVFISQGIVRNDSTYVSTASCIKEIKMDISVFQQDSLNNTVISNTSILTNY